MADKSPHKSNGKKAGKSLKEKRAAKKLKQGKGPSPFDTIDLRRR
ncbi:MAG TPA: hypothetical protein VK611_23745 [Acidimicrobiales bacterium]|nr:hypothetical protein [Acidimicrobiales bacterium]